MVVAVDVIRLLFVALPHRSLLCANAPPLLIHYANCKIQINLTGKIHQAS
jgi:hypothetical protein